VEVTYLLTLMLFAGGSNSERGDYTAYQRFDDMAACLEQIDTQTAKWVAYLQRNAALTKGAAIHAGIIEGFHVVFTGDVPDDGDPRTFYRTAHSFVRLHCQPEHSLVPADQVRARRLLP